MEETSTSVQKLSRIVNRAIGKPMYIKTSHITIIYMEQYVYAFQISENRNAFKI